MSKIEKIQNHSWNFIFEITSKDGEKIFLTDSEKEIKINENPYLPNSSLRIEKSAFDESGICSVSISGFFEENGIKSIEQIKNSSFKISVFLDNGEIMDILEYFFDSSEENGTEFKITLTPITSLYNSNITKNYSTYCRAKFKDELCKVDPSSFIGETCDKSFTMCCNKFKNAINFRGEPFIPTLGYFSGKHE